MIRSRCITILAIMLCGALASPGHAQTLTAYNTRYYTIYTDLDPEQVREAEVRMTRMAEEYRNRTRDFSGEIKIGMPFYLYKNEEDYLKTGAPKGSSGYFNGVELVAFAENLSPRAWSTIQHEAFHEFAHFVIRGHFPAWVNEGLAEYFSEAIFTGDGFITGGIPQWRLERIRKTFEANSFRPLDQMMELTKAEWNADLTVSNYDQAWSMVHFLAHGKEGKYQKVLGKFMGRIGEGIDWRIAWRQTFGDTKGFEEQWREYWTTLPNNPTLDLYIRANVATLTSFYARAFTQGQRFTSYGEFARAAAEGALKSRAEEWLPASLLKSALKQADVLAEAGFSYSISASPQPRPQIVCTLKDGRQVVGKFEVRNGRVTAVSADLLLRRPTTGRR